jgi:hypothetical protein
MESAKSKPVVRRHKVALVQGEAFRCEAVEVEPGKWKRVPDGASLPRVLEVVQLLRDCDAAYVDKNGTCRLTGKICSLARLLISP